MASTTAIIHLTDTHFKAATRDNLLPRAALIADAVRAYSFGASNCVILFSGDIAYSGAAEEYEIAAAFLSDLEASLRRKSFAEVAIITTAGNHDCNFQWQHSGAREDLIKGPQATKQVEFCLGVQGEYTHFAKNYSPGKPVHPLIHEHEVSWLPGLKFWAINSAWASLIPEKCGTMILPDAMFDLVPTEGSSIIAIMHHPIGWFEPETQRKLQRWMSGHFHFVLFGHEHEGDTYQTIGFGAKHNVVYRLGQCMGPHRSSEPSGFTLFVLDDSAYSLTEIPFLFSSNHFAAQEKDFETSLALRRPLRPVDLWFSRHFYEEFLNDLGFTLAHHRRSTQVTLEDVFVFPQLRRRDGKVGQSEEARSSVTRQDFIAELTNSSLTFVFGGESSGLTSLAKVSAVLLAEKGAKPIFVSADKVNIAQRHQAQAAFEKMVRVQTRVSYDEYFSRSRRGATVAVVDGFDLVPNDAKEASIRELQQRFDHVAIFARDVLEVESLISDGSLASIVGTAHAWNLMPIGLELRGELIRKWLSIGAPADESKEVFRANCTYARKIVDQLIGRFMLPKVPKSVLLVLQQLEALRDNRNVITDGTQGFFVQSIASDAMKSKVRCVKIDSAFSFLGLLAREMRSSGHRNLGKADLRRVHLSFQQIFLQEIPLERLLVELEKTGILRCRQDDNQETVFCSFRYDYWYHFFLARILVFMPDAWGSAEFARLVKSVHTEESCNTLSFISHLSPDNRVLDALIELANSLYPSSVECDLAEGSVILKDVHRHLPKPVLEDGDELEIEAKRDRERDKEVMARPDGYDDEILEDASEANRAFKVIQVLGQVLRSSSGSLTGNDKLRVIECCISLVRRLLQTMLMVFKTSFAELISRAIESSHVQGVSADKAEKSAKSFVGMMIVGSILVAVERITSALGARDLTLAYNRYIQINPNKTCQLLILATKIEFFHELPQSELDDFILRVRDQEIFLRKILQVTMLKRFYLFKHDFQLKRKYCAKLGIAHQSQGGLPQLALFSRGGDVKQNR